MNKPQSTNPHVIILNPAFSDDGESPGRLMAVVEWREG